MSGAPSIFAYPDGITAVDAGYKHPLKAAIHFIVEQGRVAVVDSGVNDSLPHVLAALQSLGLTPEAVDWLLLTHVHLDHAGGAGRMIQVFPHAQLVVHARGARHMVDPSKLLAGVRAVYGDEATQRMYGDIVPIPEARVVVGEEGHTLHLAGRAIQCLDTPGHARHHLCYHDSGSGAVFTGDIFGLSYRDMDIPNATGGMRQFVFPTTSPVQFEPAAMHDSIDRVCTLQPTFVYATHFGQFNDIPGKARMLHHIVRGHTEVALAAREKGALRHAVIKEGLTRLLLAEARSFGSTASDEALLALWAGDLELNAQGLGIWLDAGAPGA